MAMPPGLDSAKQLKARMKAKKGEAAPEKKPSNGDTFTGDDVTKTLSALTAEGGEESEEMDTLEEMSETPEFEASGESAEYEAGEKDPAKVFADVLGVSDILAQAAYSEAMGMPELADMSPDQMAKKIKGNYEMLKKILESMAQKAEMAMRNDLNAPAGEMPEGPGAPPAGPDAGGMPPGM